MSEMTKLQALIAVKETIGTKEKWTQRAYARDASGQKADPYSAEATCFCIHGAAGRVTRMVGYALFSEVHSALRAVMDGSVTAFNDSHTFEEVHERLDHAIAQA